MVSDEEQLGCALKAFGFAHSKGENWGAKKIVYFKKSGITSMNDLVFCCKEQTSNLELDLNGVSSEEAMQCLKNFFPGPVGLRCFQLAQKAVEMVEKGRADTKYVHRHSGQLENEQWKVPVNSNGDWKLHVDCTGFVRNVLEQIMGTPFVVALSDRDFMRAKDFYSFFQSLPHTILSNDAIQDTEMRTKWHRVPDLRMVIPGDLIVYCQTGNAAGGAAFTRYDRGDLSSLLKAVKTAQLWRQEGNDCNCLFTRNFARDPRVNPWVEAVKAKLCEIGIKSARDVKDGIHSMNSQLKDRGHSILSEDTLRLMKECSEATALNTGHIVLAAGPTVKKAENEYLLLVVHSTKYGKKEKTGKVIEGVQKNYQRFKMVEGLGRRMIWTHEITRSLEEGNEGESPFGGTKFEASSDGSTCAGRKDTEGRLELEVLAARMCF